MRLSACLILLLLLLPAAIALTASPAQRTIPAPGGDLTYSLTVRNDEAAAVDVTFTPSGPFAGSIDVPDAITLASGEQQTVQISVSIPEGVQPGTLEGGILLESRGRSEGTVSASSAVFHAIRIVTPQEGQYLEGELIAASSSAGTPTMITLVLRNTGTEDVDAVVRLSSGSQRLTTEEVAVPVGATRNVVASWTPQRVGQYTLTAQASYAGKEISFEKAMTVGDLSVGIIDVSVGEFVLGRPFRIAVDAQSAWGEPLSVTASVTIAQNGTAKQSGESVPMTLQPGERTSMPVFLESQGLFEGQAELRVQLVYAGRVESQTTPIYITQEGILMAGKEPQRGISTGLIWGFGLLTAAIFIIIFIIWFRSSRRKGV